MACGIRARDTGPLNLKLLLVEALHLSKAWGEMDDGFENGWNPNSSDFNEVADLMIAHHGDVYCVQWVRDKGLGSKFEWPNGVVGNTDGTPECELRYGK